jgi:hypothetical protein
MIMPRAKALAILGPVALLLAFSGSASAKTVSYTGKGTHLQPGQTKGLPVFDLTGKGCPTGPHCFDHATVQNLNAVSWAYPNCPEVLDGLWDLAKPAHRVGKDKPHAWHASGSSDDYAADHVTISGRFLRNGKTAKGWFTVTDSGCSTGKIYWTATPD